MSDEASIQNISAFMLMSTGLADLLKAAVLSDEPEEEIAQAFRVAICREPRPEELAELMEQFTAAKERLYHRKGHSQ